MPLSIPRRAAPLHLSVTSRSVSAFTQYVEARHSLLCPHHLPLVSQRTAFVTRLQCSFYTTACRIVRPTRDGPLCFREDPGTFTSELSRIRSPSYESNIATWVNRQFPGRDLHPLETQHYGLHACIKWVSQVFLNVNIADSLEN